MKLVLLQVLLVAPHVACLATAADAKAKLLDKFMRQGEDIQIQAGGHVEARPHVMVETGKMKGMYPFYHTADEIKSEVERLSQKCGGMLSHNTISENGVDLDTITVRKPGAKAVNRVFMAFGEHSRELISSESGLHLLRTLCGDVESSDAKAANVLDNSEFMMVLNSNPRSRAKVEQGDYCLRTNPEGVDLNRNWDEYFDVSSVQGEGQTYSGPKPFSEPETRILRNVISAYRPTTFFTIHSGTRGMYMPFAYDRVHTATYNAPAMMEILTAVDKEHCQCPFGAAGKEVGYSCPGTSLDYVYDKLKTPFVFAYEIYTSPEEDEDLKSRWTEKIESGGGVLLEQGNHLAHSHFHDIFSNHTSDFVHLDPSKAALLESSSEQDMNPDDCFKQFNPHTQELYESVVKNWVSAYIQTASMAAEKIRSGKVPSASTAAA